MNILNLITAGDSASWDDDPYVDPQTNSALTSAVWTLKYEIRGANQLTLTATAKGDGWTTTISTVNSATLTAGQYKWAATLNKSGERKTIGAGVLQVLPDLTSISSAIDSRSVAEIALADCEKALATFTSSNGKIKSYTVGTRQTEFQSIADIMALRNFWQIRVNAERAKAAVANGKGNPRRLLVRLP